MHSPTKIIFAGLLLTMTAGGGNAEMIALGTVKPKLTLYDVKLEPSIDVRGDVLTTAAAANVKLDVDVLFAQSLFVEKTRKLIEEKLLPKDVVAGTCTVTIDSLKDYNFYVESNTGFLNAMVSVKPCGFPHGDVSIEARLVPQADKEALGVKFTRLVVKIPFFWRTAGWFGGRDLEKEIVDKITAEARDGGFKMPKFEGGRAAFQGASLDKRGQSIVLRLRGDAQVDQPRVVKLLADVELLKNLEYSYPPKPARTSSR
jgi:hypothetical protein